MAKRTPEHNAKIGAANRARGVGNTPTKVCPKCKEEKPREAFKLRDNGHSYSYCRPCHLAYARERHHVPHNKAKAAIRNRRQTLRKYGLTLESYDALVESQGGRCGICGTDAPGRGHGNMPVDHDHVTGKVRGLLCHQCNRAIGLLGDNIEQIEAALAYLKRHHES